MFCENCGHQVREGERFCESCGAPLAPFQPPAGDGFQQPVQQPYEQPIQQQYAQPPYEQPVQPPYEQPVQQQYAPPVQQDQFDAPTQQYAPVQPKQPMSKKAKLIILIAGIGTVVLAAFLIVLFTVIIPSAKRGAELNIKDYITVYFDANESESGYYVVNGFIDGEFDLDYGKFIKDQKLPEFTDKYDTALYDFGSAADITFTKTTGVKSPDDAGDYFYRASKDDVFTVTVKWPSNGGILSEAYRREFAAYEQEYGVRFNTEDQVFELKLGDLLAAQEISVNETAKADVLGYIKENDLIYITGENDGYLNAYVKAFDTKLGDYRFVKEDKASRVDVYNAKNEFVDDFFIEFNDESFLKNGDKITLSYDEYDVEDLAEKGVLLTGEAVAYTVNADVKTTLPATTPTQPATTAPATGATSPTEAKAKGMSAEEAKANAEGLKAFFLEHVSEQDDKAKSGDKFEVKNIYYCKSKDTDFVRLVCIFENTTGKYFRAIEISPEYLSADNGKVTSTSTYYSASDPGKTLEEATENNWYLSKTYSKFYDITKIV